LRVAKSLGRFLRRHHGPRNVVPTVLGDAIKYKQVVVMQ
jgi:hypothetical protein